MAPLSPATRRSFFGGIAIAGIISGIVSPLRARPAQPGSPAAGGSNEPLERDQAAVASEEALVEFASVPPEEFVLVPASPLVLTAASERSQSSGLPPPAPPIPVVQPPGRATGSRARSDPDVAGRVAAGLASGRASGGGPSRSRQRLGGQQQQQSSDASA